MKKRRIASLLGAVLLSASLVNQIPVNAMTNTVFHTVDSTQIETTTTDNGELKIEDKAISDSTYFTYGQGCFFTTVVKDEKDADGQEVLTETTQEPQQQSGTESDSQNIDVSSGDVMANTCVVSSLELFNACFSEEEKAAMAAGTNMELRITFHNADEKEINKKSMNKLEENMNECMAETLFMELRGYVQITVEKKNLTTKEWETIKKFNNPVGVRVDILSDYMVQEGDYCLIGSKSVAGDSFDDLDEYQETLTINAVKSDFYALCFTPTTEEPIATAAPVKQATYWDKMMDKNEACLWHFFMIPFILLGFVWIVAINRKKNRVVFMAIIDMILLVCAILGKDWIDWAVFGGSVFVLFIVHVLKTNSWKKKRI